MVRAGSVGGAVMLVLATLVLGGGNCDGGGATTCASDSECGSGNYCASGTCSALGECSVASDCTVQPLTEPSCSGSWMCVSSECSFECTGPLPGTGQTCGSAGTCATGLECISYYGIAGPSGPRFQSCEQRCTQNSDCGTGASCVTIADGPGNVCRARQG